MKYSEQKNQDLANQAMANELVEQARVERKNRRRLQAVLTIVKIGLVVVVLLFIVKAALPFISGSEMRNKQRRETVESVVREIVQYRSTHRGQLPYQHNRRHWQDEFVSKQLGDDKPFMKKADGASYAVEVNESKSNDELVDEVVYINQSAKCGEAGKLESGAGSTVAAVRLKLEAGEVYCRDTN